MQRRKYLALTAGALTFAGCSSPSSSSGNNSTAGGTSGGNNSSATTAAATTEQTTQTQQTETQTNSRPTAEETTQTQQGTTQAQQTTGQAAQSFGPKEFSGSGTDTTEQFQLSTGPVTAEFSHDGSSNFITSLVALEGESYNDVSLTNAIGEIEGKQVRSVSQSGPYKLNVNADGNWSVTLAQPANPSPKSLPVDASGDGPNYAGPFTFDGPTEFQASHEGDGNFIVEGVPLDSSSFGSIVFNKIGQFEGSTTKRINGVAYLNVQANGNWTLQTK
jgi:hypothetical protein